jgi:fructose-specific phosphotransferase system IIA component
MNFNMRGALRIGVGMIPRGEVALIIGSIGIATGILNDSLFSIAIFMTLVTTVVTPPILSHLLKNGKMGTRTKMTGSNTVSTTFSFPSRQMTEMALVKIIGSMKNEGFFIHELDVEDHKIYQVRKDEIFLTFHEYDEKLEVVSEQANVFFVKTVTYESLLALHDTINEIKNITKPEQLKEQLKDLYAYRDNTVIDEYLKGIRLNCITMDLVSTDKKDVIRELLGTLDKARLLNNYTECLNAVMEREEVMTTGLGKGIAIPHAKTDGVSDLAIAVGIKKNGVDFQSIDGEPARVFVMMISPKNAIGPHLQVLSYISAMLHNTEVREAILNAASPGEVKDLLLKKR